jgi:hypothetical protein
MPLAEANDLSVPVIHLANHLSVPVIHLGCHYRRFFKAKSVEFFSVRFWMFFTISLCALIPTVTTLGFTLSLPIKKPIIKTVSLPIQKSATNLHRCRFRNRQSTVPLQYQKSVTKNCVAADSEIDSDGGVISTLLLFFFCVYIPQAVLGIISTT